MSYVQGEFNFVRNYCMYTWVCIDFSCCVNQFRTTQLVDFIMHVAQSISSCIKSIVSLIHWESTCVSSKSFEYQGVCDSIGIRP